MFYGASMKIKDSNWIGLFIFGLALFLNLWQLGAGPLIKTEGVRALTAHQIAQNGDWLIPRLYGSVYLTKPPLYYWVLAVAEKLAGGASEWVWRFPSALGSALLAWFLWFFTRRWFGNRAGLVAGLCFILLFPLWTQQRSAEIDALNNAASVLAACGLLELALGTGRRRVGWSLAVAFGLGVALMMKGPAGLPVILGAIAGASVVTRSVRWLGAKAVWLGISAGLAVFVLWIGAVYWRISGDPDLSGAREVVRRLNPAAVGDNWWQIVSLPVLLWAYALPFSVALLLSCWPVIVRKNLSVEGRRRLDAVAWSYGLSLVICALGLIANPRYGYMTLPLVCVLAGAVVSHWAAYAPKLQRAVGVLVILSAAAAVVLGLILVLRAWLGEVVGVLWVLLSTLIGIMTLWGMIVGLKRERYAFVGWGGLVVGVCLSLVFNEARVVERERISGKVTAVALREAVRADEVVNAEALVRYHPEIFYYADRRVQRHGGGLGKGGVTNAGWFLLHQSEWGPWSQREPEKLQLIKRLPGPDKPYLCIYRPR